MQIKRSELFGTDGSYKGLETVAEELRNLPPKQVYVPMIAASNRFHRWWLVRVRKIDPKDIIMVGDWRGSFEPLPSVDGIVPFTPRDYQSDVLDAVASEVPPAEVATQSHGRIVRSDKHPEYDPDHKRTGGRIVKTMPRQLRKIKEAQEKAPVDD